MGNRVSDGGNNAAAEIARRIAEEAARRAAEAARQAAEAARRAAAQAQRNQAQGNTPLRADTYEAAQSAAAQEAWLQGTDLSVQSLNSAQATSLFTEDVHDTAENCLDASIEYAAETNGEVILLDPAPQSPSMVGHALVRNEEGYWDPSTGETYATFKDWQAASVDSSGSSSVTHGDLYQLSPELGLDGTTGEPQGISGHALYEITTAPPAERAQLIRELSEEIGVSPTFFGERAYANGAPITVPADVDRVRFGEDPAGVDRVRVSDLGEPLSSQLMASYAVWENTSAGAGVSFASMADGSGELYVAVNADGQLVDIQNGTPQVFETGTVNTLSIFANVNMQEPAQVEQAYASALGLTQGQPIQPLSTSGPLTADQIAAYQQLGYTVAVLDPANGNAAIRPPGAQGSGDIANIGAEPGAEPVYVLVGGPPLSTFGDLTPEQLGELYTAAGTLPDPSIARADEVDAAVGNILSDVSALGEGGELPQGAMTALTMFALQQHPPKAPLDWISEAGLNSMVDVLVHRGGAEAVAGLSMLSVHPGNEQAGILSGALAEQAVRVATTPELAQVVLNSVGLQNQEAFIGSMLGLDATNSQLPLAVSMRTDDFARFMDLVAGLPTTPGVPDVAQANFFIAAFNAVSAETWRNDSFRASMGNGLATTFAMGDSGLAQAEGARLSALMGNEHMGELLASVSPQDREQITLLMLSTPGLTSELLDEHDGNLATAVAYARYSQAVEMETAGLLDGTPVLGPDGQPVIPGGELPAPPPGLDMSAHPEIAALPQPLTAAGIQQAVAAGELTGADAAAYLRALAERSTPLATAQMDGAVESGGWLAQRIGTEAMVNIIGFFEDFNPTNEANPLRATNVDDMAQVQQETLLQLASILEGSNDPAFIAQGLSTGMRVDDALWQSLPSFGEAVAAMGDRVQGNRRMAMMAVGIAASIAAPMMLSHGLGMMAAGTASSTIFGVPVAVTPFISAALPAAATTVMGVTTNAAGQFEEHGSVDWGNAIMGGTVDGLTSFFGATVAARATAQGWGLTRTVLTSGAIDAAGSFGSYALGTPGALEGILNGDPVHLNAALNQAGFSFVLSAGINGVTYRTPTGTPPALNPSTNYAGNSTTMESLLSNGPGSIFDGGPPILGLNGDVVNPQSIRSQPYESYFAVYRNSSTGEMVIQEVARSRPGTPLQLEATDTINGIRGNAPGAGWEPVGGFHNHPHGTEPSPQDMMLEPVFRGEFGEGFASFVVGSNGAHPFLNASTPPMTLQEAFAAGAPSALAEAANISRRYQNALTSAGLDPSALEVRPGLGGRPVFVDPSTNTPYVITNDGRNLRVTQAPQYLLADNLPPVEGLNPASIQAAGLTGLEPGNLRVFQEVPQGSILVDQTNGQFYLMRPDGNVTDFYVHVTTRASLDGIQSSGSIAPYDGGLDGNGLTLANGAPYVSPPELDNPDNILMGIWTLSSHNVTDWISTTNGAKSYWDVLENKLVGKANMNGLNGTHPQDELVIVFFPRSAEDPILIRNHTSPDGSLRPFSYMTQDQWNAGTSGYAPEIILTNPVSAQDITFVMTLDGQITYPNGTPPNP